MSKTAREALLSLAAEFDRLEAGTITEEAAHHANGDDDAGAMASAAGDAWRGAAARARAHARSATSGGNEGASFVPGGSHSAGIPVQWGTSQDHAACGDAIAAARALGARNALLSLAAEIEGLNDWPKLGSISDEAHQYARGVITGIALMARDRAQTGPAPAGDAPTASYQDVVELIRGDGNG